MNTDDFIQASQEGTGKWQKSDKVLNFYGRDDFEESGMKQLFLDAGIPVYEVVNDGTPRFFRRLEAVFVKIFGKKAETKQ